MRDDMAQVIVERPRHGGGLKYPRGSARQTDRVPVEDWHTREAIKRPWQAAGCRKSLNENLAPLRRFLRSSVGRPWDKVYGEICERINRNSAVQLHIWQHLVQYVCTNPYEVDGEVRRWRHEFYVDPRTGLLRENVGYAGRYKRRRGPRLERTVVPIDVNRCYERIDGIWYELDLRPRPEGGVVYDPVRRSVATFNPRGGYRQYHGRTVYVARKRQLNTREIRRVVGMRRDANATL